MGLLVIGNAFAGNNPSLKRLLNKTIHIDLSQIEVNKYSPDYVNVSFKIVDSTVQIIKIDASQRELKQEIAEALGKLQITCEYEEGKIYAYKFTFEKI